MKKSIVFAFIILFITVGWLASGQFGQVNANDKKNTENKTNINQEVQVENTEEDLNIIKVETLIFRAEQIDQSIVIQGQTVYNKKIDVKSEITGNITNINFDRGDKVQVNKNLLNISIENRKEVLASVQKDLERLNKGLIINEKNRDNLLSKNAELIKLYEIEETPDITLVPLWIGSLLYMDTMEWSSHKKRVFTSFFNYGIDLGNSGISITEFDGTTTKWEEISFQSVSGIDLDLDAGVDVLALDSTGILYAFNSDLILMAGFPLEVELQTPVLARDLFNDEHPEIVAKSADSSSVYIFDYLGNIQYRLASNKNDYLVALKNINEKNAIMTRSTIYQLDKATDTKGNEWAFEHGDWGRSRTIELEYTFVSETENQHIRSYCYPNPIRDNSGTIRVETIGAEKVEVNLYDLAGYYIKTWTEDLYQVGNQITEWIWDVTDVEPGVYFAHVAVSGDKETETNIIKIAVIH